MDEKHTDQQAYWTEKVKEAHYAGFGYWKVDWGKQDKDARWRRMQTQLGHQYAPDLYIEHALDNSFIEFSDVFRTYDVEVITSVPETIRRIARVLPYRAQEGAKGLINCEDEPYIAVGLGCAIGIMRYPYPGSLPDGSQDHVFPPVGKDMKKRMDEVVRAVRWHRIAEPFGVDNDAHIDEVLLIDYWTVQERETWIERTPGDKVYIKAPARISRRMPLPQISNLHGPEQPFVLASCYPNGAVAVVTQERTLDRACKLNPETVSIEVADLHAPVGIFGEYRELQLNYSGNIDQRNIKIYGQDLAGDTPVDITSQVEIKGNQIILPGSLIRTIGLMEASAGDSSAPGMVMQVVNN